MRSRSIWTVGPKPSALTASFMVDLLRLATRATMAYSVPISEGGAGDGRTGPDRAEGRHRRRATGAGGQAQRLRPADVHRPRRGGPRAVGGSLGARRGALGRGPRVLERPRHPVGD